jgi:hypothetical protein
LTLATPDLAGQARVAVRNPKSILRKVKNFYEYQSRNPGRLRRERCPLQFHEKRQENNEVFYRDHEAV